jgi:hypothetical protein
MYEGTGEDGLEIFKRRNQCGWTQTYEETSGSGWHSPSQVHDLPTFPSPPFPSEDGTESSRRRRSLRNVLHIRACRGKSRAKLSYVQWRISRSEAMSKSVFENMTFNEMITHGRLSRAIVNEKQNPTQRDDLTFNIHKIQ